MGLAACLQRGAPSDEILVYVLACTTAVLIPLPRWPDNHVALFLHQTLQPPEVSQRISHFFHDSSWTPDHIVPTSEDMSKHDVKH